MRLGQRTPPVVARSLGLPAPVPFATLTGCIGVIGSGRCALVDAATSSHTEG
jgi:hypothetical protein